MSALAERTRGIAQGWDGVAVGGHGAECWAGAARLHRARAATRESQTVAGESRSVPSPAVPPGPCSGRSAAPGPWGSDGSPVLLREGKQISLVGLLLLSARDLGPRNCIRVAGTCWP